MAKIVTLAELVGSSGGSVLCHGCWDVVHPGHLTHLRQAKALGDCLVVTVPADEFVGKGPGRPVFPAQQRAEFLAALDCVDYVVVNDAPSALPVIEALRPAVYVKGPDYAEGKDNAGNLEAERAAVEACGGQLVFTDGPTASSTALINQTMPPRPDLAGYLGTVKGCDVGAWLNKARAFASTVIGEAIKDEYIYVRAAGKSPKDNLLTYVHQRTEVYPGGALAVERHLAEATKRCYWACPNDTPVIKTRYVDETFTAKVFSYQPSVEVGALRLNRMRALQPKTVAVIADFGHGLIPDAAAANALTDRLRAEGAFIALTVQANSTNWGYNLLTKYSAADYVVVDEAELRLACQDLRSPLTQLVWREQTRLGADYFAVTLGHKGCLVSAIGAHGRQVIEAPALADKVVDRIGAGDAFLAWTAPLAAAGAPGEVVAFVGNVAGGAKVGIPGNKEPVTEAAVRQWVKGLLG